MKLTDEGVLITDDVVVAFMRRYESSASIAASFENACRCFVMSLDDGIRRFSHENQGDRDQERFRKMMESCENRFATNMETMKNEMNKAMDTRLGAMGESMKDKINASLADVTLALSKINMDHLRHSLNEMALSLQKEISSNKIPLAELQQSLSQSLSDRVSVSVTEPLKDILMNVNSLPGDMSHLKADITAMCQDVDNKISQKMTTTVNTILDKCSDIKTIPSLVKDRVEDLIKGVADDLSGLKASTGSILDGIKTGNEVAYETRTISHNLNSILHNNKSSKFLGNLGEKVLLDIMEREFKEKDGYTIENVSSNPHSCDILLKRTAYPDIRIDTKNNASHNKVDSTHLNKFKRDLTTQNCHGILWSIQSGIHGKAETFDMEQLPNGKVALYMSNTANNESFIKDAVDVLYTIISLMDKKDNDDDEVYKKFTPAEVVRIKDTIKDFMEKTRNALHHANETVAYIENVKKSYLPTLLQMLTNEIMPSDATTVICEYCGKHCKNSKGLNVHKSKCKPQPSTTTSVVIDQTPVEPLEKGQTTLLAHFSGPPSVINIE